MRNDDVTKLRSIKFDLLVGMWSWPDIVTEELFSEFVTGVLTVRWFMRCDKMLGIKGISNGKDVHDLNLAKLWDHEL
jgi:uncharacterized integral membrane protein